MSKGNEATENRQPPSRSSGADTVTFTSRYPNYTFGPGSDHRDRLQFVNGVAVTSNRRLIEAARNDPAFGIDFWEGTADKPADPKPGKE